MGGFFKAAFAPNAPLTSDFIGEGRLEQVGMRAGLQEQQRQLHVVLLPYHQPVWLDVTFPLSVSVARKLMWSITHGQCASGFEQSNGIENQLQVKASLLTALQVFLETMSVVNAIHDCCVFC